MSERAAVFPCGGDSLVGILHVPDVAVTDVGILVVVGGPQYRVGSHRQFTLMARCLCANGYPVFRFDYRGMGDSSGESHTFESVSDDIRAATDTFLREVPGLRAIVAFGLCDAASALLMQQDERLAGLVLANPWVRTDAGQAEAYVRHYYGARILQRSFWLKLLSGRVRLTDSLKSLYSAVVRVISKGTNNSDAGEPDFVSRMLTGARAFEGPVLLLMSGRDLTAREFDLFCERSEDWGGWVTQRNVARVDLPQADHTFSASGTLNTANDSLLSWLSRHFAGSRDPR